MNQENIQQKVIDLIDGTVECTRQMLEDRDISGKLKDIIEQAETGIRKYPVKSVAAGLLGGFIIGKIVSK